MCLSNHGLLLNFAYDSIRTYIMTTGWLVSDMSMSKSAAFVEFLGNFRRVKKWYTSMQALRR